MPSLELEIELEVTPATSSARSNLGLSDICFLLLDASTFTSPSREGAFGLLVARITPSSPPEVGIKLAVTHTPPAPPAAAWRTPAGTSTRCTLATRIVRGGWPDSVSVAALVVEAVAAHVVYNRAHSTAHKVLVEPNGSRYDSVALKELTFCGVDGA